MELWKLIFFVIAAILVCVTASPKASYHSSPYPSRDQNCVCSCPCANSENQYQNQHQGQNQNLGQHGQRRTQNGSNRRESERPEPKRGPSIWDLSRK